jgi:hypothetical protein
MLADGSRYHVTPSTLLPLDPMDLAPVERASQRRTAPEEILIATVRIGRGRMQSYEQVPIAPQSHRNMIK